MSKSFASSERSSRPVAGVSAQNRTPTLTEAQFDWIAAKVRSITGISLPKQKQVLVQSRILKRLRTLKMASFEQYLDYLKSPSGNDETVAFCNALTTNLTSFFRENHHFEHLRKSLSQPGFVQGSKLSIWSAGCSTGQEPYSIAMVISGLMHSERWTDVSILATDIDTNVLSTAKEGVYRSDDTTTIPSAYARNVRPGPNKGFHTVSPNLKNMITFRHANLMGEFPPPGSLDVIFCRNVVIYFDQPTKHGVIEKFARCLRPGGFLFLGHSETIMQPHDMLEMVGQTTFRRKS